MKTLFTILSILTLAAIVNLRFYNQIDRVAIVCGFTQGNDLEVVIGHSQAYINTPAEGRAQDCIELSNYTDAEICECYTKEGLTDKLCE